MNKIVGNNQQISSKKKASASASSADCEKNDNGVEVKSKNKIIGNTQHLDPADKYSKPSSKISSSIMNFLSGSHGGYGNKLCSPWKGGMDFLLAQVQVVVVLAIAYIGDHWKYSYPRNDNKNYNMFWVMNAVLLVGGIISWKHNEKESARGVQLLSRSQTEEWKGWMQWAFIMYHYYRMYPVYNEIRVFVSAYVWMTGFGNFLYFEKTKDFSIERAVSMWIRINYFPLLLSIFLDVKLELYYVVPLHTAGFFIAMATCYLSHGILQQRQGWEEPHHANAAAIFVCLLVHIIFYETPAVDLLKNISDEYHFRFQSDKYSAWVGILSGFVWFKFKEYMQWCYAPTNEEQNDTEKTRKLIAMWGQRLGGALLIFLWYNLFGWITDKYTYNPWHPYVFLMPLAGWLMIRNSSKYLCEAHAGVMEFFGRITLETYVLQFHVFMCNQVQHIPIVIPGSGSDGPEYLKFLNMLLCGVIFVALAYWARQITVTTQTSITELVRLLLRGVPPEDKNSNGDSNQEGSSGGDTEKLISGNSSGNGWSAAFSGPKESV